MSRHMESMQKYGKVKFAHVGVVAALLLVGYGIYAFISGDCILVGRGNPPIGTFVTFYGVDARLISLIYIGAGVWLFSGSYLSKCYGMHRKAQVISWGGATFLLVGMCSLVVILYLGIFK